MDEVGVQHIVAPYEADAQLAYLMKKNYVQAVVTEDSDLLAFGCSTVIFKLNRYGDCERIFFNDIPQVINIKPFTTTTLRHICMLSGCDYIPSLKGIGLKTAEALLRTHTTIEKVNIIVFLTLVFYTYDVYKRGKLSLFAFHYFLFTLFYLTGNESS